MATGKIARVAPASALRAVVQIADDPPALVAGGSGDAPARGGELRARAA